MKKSLEIFQEFEAAAIEWGKQYQIAKVGDIVVTKSGVNRKRFCKISSVKVAIGRNPFETSLKTFTVHYIGRRMKKDETFIDPVGTGILLNEFITENGFRYYAQEEGISDVINDCGLSFEIETEQEAIAAYPLAHQNYQTCKYPYSR